MDKEEEERERSEEGEEEPHSSLCTQLIPWAQRPCGCPGGRARQHAEVALALELGLAVHSRGLALLFSL